MGDLEAEHESDRVVASRVARCLTIAGLLAGSRWPAGARLAGQQTTPPPPAGAPRADGRRPAGQRGGRPRRRRRPIDEQRARQLYVSNKFEDHSRPNFQAQIDTKAKEDARYAAACKGIMECTKVTYRSSVGDMDIPAYCFSRSTSAARKGHAAMIWVHGGVHGNWSISYFPFVKEAVQRGYVIIAPEYRGSTGYGEAHYLAIDYGGKEVDDVMSAVDYLKTLPHVDADRVGNDGLEPRRLHHAAVGLSAISTRSRPAPRSCRSRTWSSACRTRARAISAISRRSRRSSACRSRSATLYIKRSPLYHVDKLKVPLLVHVATNDTDVDLRGRSADRRRAALAQAGSARRRRPTSIPTSVRRAAATRSAGAPTRRRCSARTRRRRSTPGTGRGCSSSGTCGRTKIDPSR